jgi:inhibitor of cysteine peptidase
LTIAGILIKAGYQKLRRCSMKRFMTILVVAAVIGILLTACGTAGPKVYSDPSQIISVKVGQNFIIALDENPTTGYRWQEEFDASFLELVGDKYEPSSEAKKPGIVGAGGTRSFEFKASKKGETKVTLVYKQPWKGGGVGETKVFTVSIK